jgi:hypothetical protein
VLSKKEMSEFLLNNLALFIGLPKSQVQQSLFRGIDHLKELTQQNCFTLGMLIERMQHDNFGDKEILEQIKIAILTELNKEN